MFSPWSNVINERNHFSVDVIVRKIMNDDAKIVLQNAVNMAIWTYNMNELVSGYTPIQLMTGKSVV